MQQCNNLQSHTSYIPHTITQYITWSCDVMAAKPQSCDVMAAKPQSPSHSVNGQATMLHIHHLYSLFLNSTPNNMATLIKYQAKKSKHPPTFVFFTTIYNHPRDRGVCPFFLVLGPLHPFLGILGPIAPLFSLLRSGAFAPFLAPTRLSTFFLMPSSGWRPPRPIHQ
jgi:hypothetical protein